MLRKHFITWPFFFVLFRKAFLTTIRLGRLGVVRLGSRARVRPSDAAPVCCDECGTYNQPSCIHSLQCALAEI